MERANLDLKLVKSFACAPTSRKYRPALTSSFVASPTPIVGPIAVPLQWLALALLQVSLIKHSAVNSSKILESSQSPKVSLSSWGLRLIPDVKYQLSSGLALTAY